MFGTGKFSSEGFAQQAFESLRAASRTAGVGNPYLVMQDWSPATAHAYGKRLGGDAVSAYASDARGQAASFADLARHTEAW